jgi:tetratricopeptide (TPR) repeat protein
MTQGTAPLSGNIYLTRAYGFITEAEKSIAQVRACAVAHDPQAKSDPPLEWLIEGLRGLAQYDKLPNDLGLASQQIEQASATDSNAYIATSEGTLNAAHLRSRIFIVWGQLSLIGRNMDFAKHYLNSSIPIAEFSYAHYLLGLLYECQYDFADALRHFERCLEVEPIGDLSLPALREANAMRIALKNYRKSFRGSWETFWWLLVLCWPAAVVYFIKKRK